MQRPRENRQRSQISLLTVATILLIVAISTVRDINAQSAQIKTNSSAYFWSSYAKDYDKATRPAIENISWRVSTTESHANAPVPLANATFATGSEHQVIHLNAGWNMVSSYLQPENTDLSILLADIASDLVLMKNGSGEVYWPEMGDNTIVNWEIADGYQMYVANSATLTITGTMVDAVTNPIVLPAGWSLVSYFGDISQPVEQAMSTIEDELVLVKNGQGDVFWPALGVNGIGSLQPGQGYKVYLANPANLTYPAASNSDLHISRVTDNRSDYKNNRIPSYEKFEITFHVENSVAGNFQLPYDPNPPAGIDPAIYPKHKGISVDAYFLPPGESDWNEAYAQPGFFYRYYDYEVRDEHDWFYPADSAWKIRFSPNQPGAWQYKIRVQDDSGVYETEPRTFSVASSSNKGFIGVSQTDPRYFEFDDGSLFYQMGLQSGVTFSDPVTANESLFGSFGSNGASFIRTWISPIYGAAWPEFLGSPGYHDGYLPRPRILPFRNQADNKESMTVHIDYELEGNSGWFSNCAWQRWGDAEAVKRNTDYRIRVKYRAMDITGPRDPSFPNYGVVLKTGGNWTDACHYPDRGVALSDFGHNNDEWEYLETTWNSGESNWLTTLYVVLENVHQGDVYLDSITVQEVLGDGQLGPDIVVEGDFQYDLVYPEAKLWSLDQVLNFAEDNDVYLKMVVGDKGDKMWWKIDDDGTYVIDGEQDNQSGYYGNWYNLDTNNTNRTRWLQRAWWRYLQARYGYSPNVHSWEFTNEGDPNSGKHWSATDLMGRYMKCEVFGVPTPDSNGDGLPIEGDKCDYDHPNAHMVSTSFWHSFPASGFWGNKDWPNVDYADVHTYTNTGWQKNPQHVDDMALYHLDYSADVRAQLDAASGENGIATKPVVRGEVGLDVEVVEEDLLRDMSGVWLHNLLWSTLDPGAMSEIWWQLRDEIAIPPGPDGQRGLYEIYKYFSSFVSNIPLNNGHYRDAEATLTDSDLRVTGQKDLVNERAHLWIQNKNHTWRKVVDDSATSGLSGTVSIGGFPPNNSLNLEWHYFTTQGIPNIVRDNSTTDASGTLTLTLPSDPDLTDVAVKVGDY